MDKCNKTFFFEIYKFGRKTGAFVSESHLQPSLIFAALARTYPVGVVERRVNIRLGRELLSTTKALAYFFYKKSFYWISKNDMQLK
jgi:hypothetical protein